MVALSFATNSHRFDSFLSNSIHIVIVSLEPIVRLISTIFNSSSWYAWVDCVLLHLCVVLYVYFIAAVWWCLKCVVKYSFIWIMFFDLVWKIVNIHTFRWMYCTRVCIMSVYCRCAVVFFSLLQICMRIFLLYICYACVQTICM